MRWWKVYPPAAAESVYVTDWRFLDGLDLDPKQIVRTAAERTAHAHDAGQDHDATTRPDVVVYPTNTDEVSRVLAGADAHGVSVTPYAAGTSLEGNPVPTDGGISLDLSRMDRILDRRPSALQIEVEPGVIGTDIDAAVERDGLCFPPLPSSGDISTIGGMIANDASGMKTVRYGEVADWVLGLEVVLADGRVIETGTRAVKTSSGYNLTDLFVGSEGTLGVITRATLELAALPEQIRGGRAIFPDLESASAAIADCVQSGVDVAKLELLDAQSAEMVNAYLGTDLPATPMVFLEVHADHGIDEEVAFARTVLESHGPTSVTFTDAAEMESLWAARREITYAIEAWDPQLEARHDGDVTVPIDRYSELISFIDRRREEYDLFVPCFGHGGDGNVHYSFLVDPTDSDAVRSVDRFADEIVDRALELGGTATGEHGIGLGKRDALIREHGETAVDVMHSIKRTLDPNDTLNPGKIFDAD